MSDESDPLAWVEKAEEDYTLARLALRHKPPLTYGACFHAQQCAEKYLKAMLVAQRQLIPKVHDLLHLSGLCAKAGILFEIGAKDLNTLTDYGVRTRYPGEDPILEDAREALKITQAVRRFARQWLSVK